MEGLKKGILVRNRTAVGALGDKYFSTAPIGVIHAFSGQTAPNGYLLCNGASYKVADYPDLYAVIGNTYGGDTENFNVPNLVDKFIQGSTTSGEEKEAGLPNITGTFYHDPNVKLSLSGAFSYTGGSSINLQNDAANKNSGYVSFDASKSNPIYGKSTTVQPPALTMVYIIKAFHTNEGVDSGVSDDVINYINNLNSYSTEETLTGGKWIDGKPIYRKVITHTLSNALTGLVEIAHNIQNIETPIRIVFGKISVPGSPSSSITIPSQYDSTTFIQLGVFRNTYVQLFAGSTNWTSMKEITLCLEYTKTTD